MFSIGGFDPDGAVFPLNDIGIGSEFDFPDAGIDDEAGDDASAGMSSHVSFDRHEFFDAGPEVFCALEWIGEVDPIGFDAELAELSIEFDEDFGIIIYSSQEHGLVVEGDFVLRAEEESAYSLSA